MKHVLSFCVILILYIIVGTTIADEGMWPLYSLEKLPFDVLKTRGLQLKPEEIYNPNGGGIADAIVQVSATGSFISSEGLIVTNHHVAYGAIQEQSTINQNYLRDGFYAKTKADEIEARGYAASITIGIEDVTKRVLASVNDKMTDLQRYNAIDKITKQIIKENEKTGNIKCKIVSMYEGLQYIKYNTMEFRDVRIVYIPPEAIGNFGGETDNWIWPRHTGDFAFFRAYVGPDGQPAEYSPNNIPYKPKVWLPLSSSGIKEGDFAMTIGFPGTTNRYICSFELENLISFSYPQQIKTRRDEIKIIEGMGTQDSVIKLRMASDLKSIYNRQKKSLGIMEGFTRDNILDRKKDEERQLTAFLTSHPELAQKYGTVLSSLDSLYREDKKYEQHDYFLGRLTSNNDLLRMASSLYRWGVEREKPDMERGKGYQNRDTISAKSRLRSAQTNLVPVVDKELLKYSIKNVLILPAGQKVDVIEKLFAGKIGADLERAMDEFTSDLFAKTKVGNLNDRLAMFKMTKKQLLELNDPFINLAASLYPEMEKMRIREKEFNGANNRLAPKLVQAYAEWKKLTTYPDANGSMRLSYGEVKGYSPHDAVTFDFKTMLSGIMEKETGEGEFIVPAELKRIYQARDFGNYIDPVTKDVPVNFLTTNDITNGNSGSPVINGKGEIIGLAFDGNYESVASDYLFDPNVTRTIVVDIKYILFLLDKVYHLDGLMKELTIH